MSTIKPKEGVAFFCLGGAYNGPVGAGFVQGAWDNGFIPSYMQLTSVGALNGLQPIGAKNGGDRLADVWLQIEELGPSFVFRPLDIATHFNQNALFGTRGLKFLIDQLDIKKIFDSPIEVELVASNGQLSFFKNRYTTNNPEVDRERFYKSIFATTALPGIFPPVNIDGQWYTDGLVLDLNRALLHGCTEIYVISNDHDNWASPEPQNEWWLNRMGQILTTTLYGWIYEKIEVFKLVHPECQVTVIKPTKSLPHLSTFYFKKGAIKRALNHGYELATKIIKSRTS